MSTSCCTFTPGMLFAAEATISSLSQPPFSGPGWRRGAGRSRTERFWCPAAMVASRPRRESGPMKAIGRATTFSLPVRRSARRSSASPRSRTARQTGHWRSMYSTIVAGAEGLPSTLPRWRDALEERSARGRVRQGAHRRRVRRRRAAAGEGEHQADRDRDARRSRRPRRAAPSSRPVARPCSGPAVAPPGPAAAAVLACRSSSSSDTVAVGAGESGQQQEGEAEREPGQRQRRDRHVAELLDPLGRAATGAEIRHACVCLTTPFSTSRW